MSSVTTRIASAARWASSGVPPVPIASATSRSSRLSADIRPLYRIDSPDATRVATEAMVRRPVEDHFDRTPGGTTARSRPTSVAAGAARPVPRPSACRRFEPSISSRSVPASGSRWEVGHESNATRADAGPPLRSAA